LHCVALCCSMMQCDAVCILSEAVLFVAGCGCRRYICVVLPGVLQCVAPCCSV